MEARVRPLGEKKTDTVGTVEGVTDMGGGIQVSHAGTECAEHIHIIITSAQKADNVIPNLDRLLSTIHIGVIKTSGNIGISPFSCISRGVCD